MAVHFKFRSEVKFDSVDIEGPYISVAVLREKIVDKILEGKSLLRAMNFDLLLFDAQTMDEYKDDSSLVPKNTSVIIKRIPATRAKAFLRVDEQSKNHVSERVSADESHGASTLSKGPDFSMFEAGSLDDFGVDLYATPEPAQTNSMVDVDEKSRISALVDGTASDWQKQIQEGSTGARGTGRGGYGRGSAPRSTGHSFGRETPPHGYVCHRCSIPGHFIQHCPTNGDPAFDKRRMKPPAGIPKTRLRADEEGSYILPDGSVAELQPDEMGFAKEADPLLGFGPVVVDPPQELKCTLCGSIFKNAVMIPCCQYSFCDKCIRDELIAKGRCPQCESTKFKNDDLLPNISLRQAIERFLEAQMTTSWSSDSFQRQQTSRASDSFLRQQALNVESSSQKGATAAASSAKIDDQKLSDPASTSDEVTLAKKVVVEDFLSEAPKVEKEKEGEEAESSALVVGGVEDSGVVIGSSLVKENVAADLVGKQGLGVPRKVEEDWGVDIDNKAMSNASKVFEPSNAKEVKMVAMESKASKGKKKKRVSQAPAGDFYGPTSMQPNSGGNYPINWQGLHPAGDRFGWGENGYFPGPAVAPYDRPIMPGPHYGRLPYQMAPSYSAPFGHSGYMGGGPRMMNHMDGPPLSREEFLEIQERQVQERYYHRQMQENSERAFSQQQQYQRQRDLNMHFQTPYSEYPRVMESYGRVQEHDDDPRKDVDGSSRRDLPNDIVDQKLKHRMLVEDKNNFERSGNEIHPSQRGFNKKKKVSVSDEMKPYPQSPGDERLHFERWEQESSRKYREHSQHEAQTSPERLDTERSHSRSGRRIESISKHADIGDSRRRGVKRELPKNSRHSTSPDVLNRRTKHVRGHAIGKEGQQGEHGFAQDEDSKDKHVGKSRHKRHHRRMESKVEQLIPV